MGKGSLVETTKDVSHGRSDMIPTALHLVRRVLAWFSKKRLLEPFFRLKSHFQKIAEDRQGGAGPHQRTVGDSAGAE